MTELAISFRPERGDFHPTRTLLFKVISERSERSSTIVTTNLAFSEWTQMFENTTMVAVLVDRLTYRSHVLDMSGPSYRLLTAQAENESTTVASTTG